MTWRTYVRTYVRRFVRTKLFMYLVWMFVMTWWTYVWTKLFMYRYLLWMFVMTWWRMEAKLTGMSWPEGMNGCKVIPEWNTLISPGFCGSNARPKGSLLFRHGQQAFGQLRSAAFRRLFAAPSRKKTVSLFGFVFRHVSTLTSFAVFPPLSSGAKLFRCWSGAQTSPSSSSHARNSHVLLSSFFGRSLSFVCVALFSLVYCVPNRLLCSTFRSSFVVSLHSGWYYASKRQQWGYCHQHQRYFSLWWSFSSQHHYVLIPLW